MKISTKIIALVSVSVIFLASKSFAFPIVKWDKVTVWSDSGQYSVKKGDDTYHSFCLESNQYFSSGTEYLVESIGEVAYGGGTERDETDALVSANDYGEAGDEIDVRSKWLFAAYLTDKSIATSNQQVQEAIWWLEDEVDGLENSWLSLKGLYDWDNTKSNYSGWDVVAVNISIDGEVDNQSQLIGTAPVPEPATMLLFGVGLAGLAGVQRKRRA